jgi:murein DD-endopeptidase MepM/ murein hydrolase activator NlpD
MTRLVSPLILVACLFPAQTSCANRPGIHLEVVPGTVYKVDDPGGSNTSSFVFNLVVICSTDCNLTPISARVELSRAGTAVEQQDWTTESLTKIKQESYRIEADTPLESPTRAFTLPEAFDLRFYFRTPQSLAIDSAAVRLTVANARGGRAEETLRIPITYYHQKTALIVPFRGLGVVGQDWITNGGHGAFWNGFALDLRGLADDYAEVKSSSFENDSSAGWGREIIAPADGTVVYARNDVPTNPHPGKEPGSDWFAKLHDPVLARAGNCVIIDHGNSEYSVMMHMQPGSVTVKVGDHVNRGQVVGKLGNSGDAFGPHVHYQLQSGPQLFKYQTLPFKFQGVDRPLARGSNVNER